MVITDKISPPDFTFWCHPLIPPPNFINWFQVALAKKKLQVMFSRTTLLYVHPWASQSEASTHDCRILMTLWFFSRHYLKYSQRPFDPPSSEMKAPWCTYHQAQLIYQPGVAVSLRLCIKSINWIQVHSVKYLMCDSSLSDFIGPIKTITGSLFSMIIFCYVMITFLYLFTSYGFCWINEMKGKPKEKKRYQEDVVSPIKHFNLHFPSAIWGHTVCWGRLKLI